MGDESELDIQRFVERLLSTSPGGRHSITLELDVDGDPVALFEVLLTIMTSILRRWYSPPIHIGRVSETDMERLVGYFASFGIDIQIDSEQAPRVLRINNKAYENKNRLEDMTFQMSGQDMLYTVRFGFLRRL